MRLSDEKWICLDEEVGVWARTYNFNKSAWSNCFVVRIAEGELAIISPPMHMREADFQALEEHGKVIAICAPNGFHHLGIPGFAKRYPAAILYADAKTAKRVGKKNRGLKAFESVEVLAARLPEHVEIFGAQHLKTPDLMARVKTSAGTIWYSNDILINSPKLPENIVLKNLFKWTRSGPGYSVNRMVLKFFGKQPGFAEWIKCEFEKYPPYQVVVGHGHVVDEGDVPAQTRAVLEAGL